MFLVTVMQLMRRPHGAKESPRGELSVNSFGLENRSPLQVES